MVEKAVEVSKWFGNSQRKFRIDRPVGERFLYSCNTNVTFKLSKNTHKWYLDFGLFEPHFYQEEIETILNIIKKLNEGRI